MRWAKSSKGQKREIDMTYRARLILTLVISVEKKEITNASNYIFPHR